ncbi:hypothetical protein M9458_015981, partial [Cirrhinus mrigala]
PAKPNHTTRSSNQTRSRSQEPENGHMHSAHHRRSQTISTDPPAILSRHTHALRSPKTHRTPPTQASGGRVIRRGAPPPPAVPNQTPPHQSSGPYRRHKQRPKEGLHYRALGPTMTSGPVVEKEHVRDLPSLVLWSNDTSIIIIMNITIIIITSISPEE